MKENERRRRTAVMNADAEMSQYLEDERLAIMLQNSEFLQELRGNEEFMQTLERGNYPNLACKLHQMKEWTGGQLLIYSFWMITPKR